MCTVMTTMRLMEEVYGVEMKDEVVKTCVRTAMVYGVEKDNGNRRGLELLKGHSFSFTSKNISFINVHCSFHSVLSSGKLKFLVLL